VTQPSSESDCQRFWLSLVIYKAIDVSAEILEAASVYSGRL